MMKNYRLDKFAQSLYDRETIAGAVAREAKRGGVDGIAYKAAWDRKGSGAEKHIECALFDNRVMIIGRGKFCPRCMFSAFELSQQAGQVCAQCLEKL